MISHSHKFILLHAGKCAGSSVINCLNNIIDEPKIELPCNHPTLLQLQELVTKSNHNINEYKLICMVRNPFDRMVSWYNHAVYRVKTFSGSFEDFCDNRLSVTSENLIPPYNKCNHVIRFEHLQDDFDKFLDIIGLPAHNLPHENKSMSKQKVHYSVLHTEKTKQIVSEYFSSVIEMFNYKFGE